MALPPFTYNSISSFVPPPPPPPEADALANRVEGAAEEATDQKIDAIGASPSHTSKGSLAEIPAVTPRFESRSDEDVLSAAPASVVVVRSNPPFVRRSRRGAFALSGAFVGLASGLTFGYSHFLEQPGVFESQSRISAAVPSNFDANSLLSSLRSAAGELIPGPVEERTAYLDEHLEIHSNSAIGGYELTLKYRNPSAADAEQQLQMIVDSFQKEFNKTLADLDKAIPKTIETNEPPTVVATPKSIPDEEDRLKRELLAITSEDLAAVRTRLNGNAALLDQFRLQNAAIERKRAMIDQTGPMRSERIATMKVLGIKPEDLSPKMNERAPEELIEQLSLKKAELGKRLGVEHRDMIALDEQLRILKSQSNRNVPSPRRPDELDRHRIAIEMERAEVAKKIEALKETIAVDERTILSASRIQTQLDELAKRPRTIATGSKLPVASPPPAETKSEKFGVTVSEHPKEGVRVSPRLYSSLVPGGTIGLIAGASLGLLLSQLIGWSRGRARPNELILSENLPVRSGHQVVAASTSDPESFEQSNIVFEQPTVAPEEATISFEHPGIDPEQSTISSTHTDVAPEQTISFKQPDVPTEQSTISFEQPTVALEQSSIVFEQPTIAPEQATTALANLDVEPEQSGDSAEDLPVASEEHPVPTEHLGDVTEEIPLASEVADAANDPKELTVIPEQPTAAPEKSVSPIVPAPSGSLFGRLKLPSLLTRSDKKVQEEPRFSVPLLGRIPRIASDIPHERKSLEGIARTLIALLRPSGPEAEAFRTARKELAKVLQNRGHQVILVTSQNDGDGKSTIAGNLAISLAQTGKRVLLIDAELRGRHTQQMFHLMRLGDSLRSVLASEADIQVAIRATEIANLFVLPAGRGEMNPFDLFSRAKFVNLIAEQRAKYEYVILDGPSAQTPRELALLAGLCVGAIAVVREDGNNSASVERAIATVIAAGVPLVGIIMNTIPPSQPAESPEPPIRETSTPRDSITA